MPNLVGTGLNQVPTNSMLGGLAYQDPEHASIKNLDLKNLSQINSEIANTAVDIFIYDTSKDSDGGAWRKRTTNTSWYNETLGTATRGTRREFPSVAVIVVTAATTRKLYIYDGDDPNLPMWMVIDTTDGQWPQAEFSSLYALNGIIALGSASNTQPLYETRNRLDLYYFVSDKIESSGAGTGGTYYGTVEGLVNRRTHATNRGTPLGNSVYDLVNISVTDVAMHVQPNARVDTTTGLPIPVIAVGTDDHLCIIKEDGTTADYDGFNPTQLIEICSGSVFGTAVPGNGYNYIYKTDIKTSDGTYNTDIVAGSNNYYIDSSGTIPRMRFMGIDDFVIDPVEKTAYRAGSAGIDIIRTGRTVSNSHAILPIAYIASDYNTGYMVGDIKGAFLSETTTGNLSTTDLGLITNGDFSNGTTGWSNDATPTFTVSGGGVASVDRNGGGATGQCYQTITTEVGRTYTVGVLVSAVSNGFQVYAGKSPSASNIPMSQGAINSTGTHYWTFTAATTSTRLDFSATQNVNGTASFDNITIFDGVADRSVNRKGLSVFGTVTKSAVATGADLVAYSGFTDNDYLKQPYNSDLDFGTGDYYMSIWAKGGGNNQCLMIREHGVSSGNGLDADGAILIFQASGKYNFYSRQDGTATWTAFSANNATFGNYWSHVMLVRRGGTMYGYVNGNLEGSTSFAGNVSNNDAELFFGRRNPSVNNTQEYSGSLALARIGGSAPSPEQIKKMYEDEKVLFQENAKCTLYGSSDAVTALAYDDDTDLLHVGTSSGRSDFQGLRRINNTTTAVTTAISASDDLIAEQ